MTDLRALLARTADQVAAYRAAAAEVEPAMVATTGPRYFGFVIGGALDAATAADVLTVGWDQPAYNHLSSPAAALVEEIADVGWDVERDGLVGSPALRVVASEERHATIDRSLRLLGLGAGSVEPVPADENGAIDVAALRNVLTSKPDGPTIVCLQSGNVNTGACDDLVAAVGAAHEHRAWAHVDGAFGLWAASG